MKRRTKLCGWSQFGAVALALLSTVACVARSSGTRTEVVGDLEWKYVAEGNGAAAVVCCVRQRRQAGQGNGNRSRGV